MTCIVGIRDKKNNRVVIGGDSAAVHPHTMMRTVREDTKVFTNGSYVIGYTTSFRMGQLLRYHELPEVDTWDANRFMATTFIDAIRKTADEAGYAGKDHEGRELYGTFLVGFEDKLYHVQDDLAIGVHSDGIFACGCGEDIAIGAASVLLKHTDMSAEDIVRASLEAAATYNGGVCGPFTILST